MLPDNVDELAQQLFTLRDWVRWSSSEFRRSGLFYGHGTENDFDEAVNLALWALSQPWERLELLWEARLSAEEKVVLFEAVRKRIDTRCPAAYITGEAWFCNIRFVVNENVLVPRSPIAELIQNRFQPWLSDEPQAILDLCTGSGCIGIACAFEFQDSSVDLIDISPEALEIADKNIHLHDLESRVRSIQSDGLTALGHQQYDLIVSNPPYVSEAEYAQLPQEYKMEPKLGLTSGDDGFDFVRNLLLSAEKHLTTDGLLVVEVGYGWEQFNDLFPQYPFLWPEFENGGCGVFILTRDQLVSVNSKNS